MAFVDLFAGRGEDSTTAAVTLDTVADESRKKMGDGVARSPTRLCSRDGKILLLWRRLEYDFLASLLLCLASYFSFFFSSFSYFFPASRYVYLLRVPSSVQQPSATLSKYVFYSRCSFCLCHFIKMLTNVSCEYDRWVVETLQAAYVRHAHWARLRYVPFVIWWL